MCCPPLSKAATHRLHSRLVDLRAVLVVDGHLELALHLDLVRGELRARGVVEVDLGSILMLFGSLCWGVSMIAVKILSRSDSSICITFYGVLFVAPISLIAAIPYWETPTPAELAWLAVIGVFATLTHLCYNQAIREADLTVLLPFDFTRLIWAAIVGYLVFAEVPSIWTWVGGAMIFVAGTYLAIRESRLTGAPSAVPSPGA